MSIYEPTEKNINMAASIINSSGIISFPTETVYGLGANAFDPEAIIKIFEIKNRPYFDPLIVHIAETEQLSDIAVNINEKAKILAKKFWPGPLTIVLEKSEKVPDIVTSGLKTIACRIPDHPVALKLIQKTGKPIAAPSANPFGYLSPTKAEHVKKLLGDKIEMILDGGDSSIGIESTIIKFHGDKNIILRHGGISIKKLEKEIGKIEIKNNIIDLPETPGQMEYHYSPSTDLKLVNIIQNADFTDKSTGYLFFKHPKKKIHADNRIEILSQEGDLNEAAANLFSSLHRLDKLNLKIIIAESVPENGLGVAIMDRLKKASKKFKG